MHNEWKPWDWRHPFRDHAQYLRPLYCVPPPPHHQEPHAPPICLANARFPFPSPSFPPSLTRPQVCLMVVSKAFSLGSLTTRPSETASPRLSSLRRVQAPCLYPWFPARNSSLVGGVRQVNERMNKWKQGGFLWPSDMPYFDVADFTGRTDYSVSRRWYSWIQLYKNICLPVFGLHAISPVGQVEPMPGAPPIQRHRGTWGSQPSSSVGTRHTEMNPARGQKPRCIKSSWKETLDPKQETQAPHTPWAIYSFS